MTIKDRPRYGVFCPLLPKDRQAVGQFVGLAEAMGQQNVLDMHCPGASGFQTKWSEAHLPHAHQIRKLSGTRR